MNTDSYIQTTAGDVAKKAEVLIEAIDTREIRGWEAVYNEERCKRKFWQTFFPWLRNLTDYDIREKLRPEFRRRPDMEYMFVRSRLVELRDFGRYSKDAPVYLTLKDYRLLQTQIQ